MVTKFKVQSLKFKDLSSFFNSSTLTKSCFQFYSNLLLSDFFLFVFSAFRSLNFDLYTFNFLVEANGVEPMTYCVQGSRSSQLS
jgi:hypothetical protein